MSIFKQLRKLFIKSTDFTHSYQGKDKKLIGFYKAWSYCYDLSIGLDPAYGRELNKMIGMTVKQGDTVLDIGCGTGISTFYASGIANKVIGIDLSPDMIRKLEKKSNGKNHSILK